MLTMTGQWQGEFTYGPEYGEDYEGKKVGFMLRLKDMDGQFEGDCIDEEAIETGPLVASINGFVERDFISFIKQYPFSHSVDEEGQSHIDYTQPHPEIHYSGYYDASTQTFSGEWEMVVEEEISDDGTLEYLLTGEWKMKKQS